MRRLPVRAKAKEQKLESAGMMRWLLTYADMITLLLAFFILLFSMSVIQKQRYEALVEALKAVLEGKHVQVARVHRSKTAPYPLRMPDSGRTPAAVPRLASETRLYRELRQAVQAAGLQQYVLVARSPYGVEVIFFRGILFATGSADLRPEARRALDVIGGVLRGVPNQLVVQGYANKLPIDTAVYPSNWDLSAARAARVVDYWRSRFDMAPTRFMIEAFGRWAPLVPGGSPQALKSNRAVTVLALDRVYSLRRIAFGPAPPQAPAR